MKQEDKAACSPTFGLLTRLLLILSLGLISWIPSGGDHSFHVSMTEIVYQAEAQQLQVTTRFFIDDIALALGEGEHYFDLSDSSTDAIQAQVGAYYTQHFGLEVDTLHVALSFIGFELEDDLLYCYGEALDVPAFTAASASSRWLYDLYDDQVNIFNLHRDSAVYGLHLSKAKSVQAFEL